MYPTPDTASFVVDWSGPLQRRLRSRSTPGGTLVITESVSLRRHAPRALEALRRRGSGVFEMSARIFDDRHPDTFERRVRRVRLHVVGRIPPVTGVRALLCSAEGPSGPARYASPPGATGTFELTPSSDHETRITFGSDWRLSLPKTENPFPYDRISDVIVTVECTARSEGAEATTTRVDSPPALVDGRATIHIDTSALTIQTSQIEGTSGGDEPPGDRVYCLRPGQYRLQYQSGSTVSAPFVVEEDGSVSVPVGLEDAMSASSNRLTVSGLPVVVDTRKLDAPTWYINGVTRWETPGEHYLRLLPGRYRLTYASAGTILAHFDLHPDGTVSVPPEHEGALVADGNRIEFRGLPMHVDTRQLSALSFYISGVSGWLTPGQNTFHVLPGRYRLTYASEGSLFAEFELKPDGAIQVPSEYAACLSAQGEAVRVDGVAVEVDTSAMTEATYIDGVSQWAGPGLRTFRLLPGRYRVTGRTVSATFEVREDGTLTVPAPYRRFTTVSHNRITITADTERDQTGSPRE